MNVNSCEKPRRAHGRILTRFDRVCSLSRTGAGENLYFLGCAFSYEAVPRRGMDRATGPMGRRVGCPSERGEKLRY